jgi:hypothetical protein
MNKNKQEILFSINGWGNIVISGFTTDVAVSLVARMPSKGYSVGNAGVITRRAEPYAVYTTGMAVKFAINAIGLEVMDYSFYTDIPKKALMDGFYYDVVNSFEPSDEAIEKIAEVDSTIDKLRKSPNSILFVDYESIEAGMALDNKRAISAVFEYTKNTPMYVSSVDSGGRSMDEGFMTAIIAITPSGSYVPYVAVCSDGQEVDPQDLLENHDNSSFFILDEVEDLADAKESLLVWFDKQVQIIKPHMILDGHTDDWECPYDNGVDDILNNHQMGFVNSFDEYFSDDFSEARGKMSKILEGDIISNIDIREEFLSIKEAKYYESVLHNIKFIHN